MSEFKFACPVCGQHITADSSASGGQIECPTCFQKIVVPQAPTSPDSKFILSAAQVSKPRPAPVEALSQPVNPQPRRNRTAVPLVIMLLVLLGGVAALYRYGDRVIPPAVWQTLTLKRKDPRPVAGAQPEPAPSAPTNGLWSLDLHNAPFPEQNAVGQLHGTSFTCDRALLEGDVLVLRQGTAWPPDFGVAVRLPIRPGEDLAGKTVEVTADQPPPVPRVLMRWKVDQQEPVKQNIDGGYALKVAFGQPSQGRVPGKIYLCLPDDAKSYVAGTFDAELKKPKPSAPRPPKPGTRPGPP